MKDHTYYQELISRLADEDLSLTEQKELAVHLEECAECRAFQQFCNGLNQINWVTKAPEGLTTRIMEPVKRRRSIVRWTLRSVGALAACIVMFFGVRSAFGQGRSETTAGGSNASAPMMAMSQSYPAEADSDLAAVETAEEYAPAGGANALEGAGSDTANLLQENALLAESTEFDFEEACEETADAPMAAWNTTTSDHREAGETVSSSAKSSADLLLSGTLEVSDGNAIFYPEDESILGEKIEQEYCYRLAGELPPDGIYKGKFHLEKSFEEDGILVLLLSIEGELEIAN